MGFNGYLIKLGGAGGTELPMKYIAIGSYKSTPDQRMESKATRSVTGILHRTTVEHKAVKIEFTTPAITNKDVSALNTLLQGQYIDALERKIKIQFYNQETDSYREATCYMPDVDYTIDHIDLSTNTVVYNPVRFAFIEY